MTYGSYITQLGGVKQEIQDLKQDLSQFKVSIDGKFSEINLHLKDIKERFASTVIDIVMESILKVKTRLSRHSKKKTLSFKKM